ncbi:hypothetical protein [Salinivibrio kushneri]|uniref:hypothetical protein n=1 Tax=Salinivibrio kushneri TaxID=1908198 RepID=UPI000988DD98|nr:hypothetical protein [Salinivibrio kushneri]OOE63616.1 hypothetical protein BZG19_16105 [Salinivibrio kushneri]
MTGNDEQSTKEERRFRLRVVMILLPVATGVIGWSNVGLISDFFYINEKFVFLVSAYLVTVGVGTLLMLYLRGGVNIPVIDKLAFSLRPSSDVRIDQSVRLERSVKELQEKVSRLAESQVSLKEGQIDEVVESLKDTIGENLSSSLEERFADKAIGMREVERASDTYEIAASRLDQEIATLSRRANLNLVIGVLTTAAAVGLLIYMVLGNEQFPSDLSGLLSYYIPRVTIVVFVEIFSYFFLRLYKSNLEEIKYYQSQITDIYHHQVAHSVAVLSEQESLKREFLSGSLDDKNVDSSSSRGGSETEIRQLASMIEGISKTITAVAGKSK